MPDKNAAIRVWSEFLSYDDLCKPEVVDLLINCGVGLNVSVHHDKKFEDIKRMLDVYAARGVSVCLWILISKPDGYFPSGRTVDAFKKRAHAILDDIERARLPVPLIAVDLEPPLYMMERYSIKKRADRKALKTELKRGLQKNVFDDWTRDLQKLNDGFHSRGAKTLVAASFTVADDYRAGDFFTQGLMGTPVLQIDWDVVSIMWYVSMFAGYSRGILSLDHARYQLWRDAKTLVDAIGEERASVSLGVTWTGVLGNEPYYKNPADILPDARAAKAAGIKHLWLYNLEGVLKAKRPADWFDVLQNGEAIAPQENFGAKISFGARNIALRAARLYFR